VVSLSLGNSSAKKIFYVIETGEIAKDTTPGLGFKQPKIVIGIDKARKINVTI